MKLPENGDQFLLRFLLKMKRKLTLSKLDYILNFHYNEVSAQKWTIPFKEVASLLRNFYRDPLRP